ncbi:MAG: GNAT family N-acetyltransferase, partial [Acidimicrobiia bacterium]
VRAVRAVDTATHPDFQGQGVFSRLTRAALTALEEEADLVFNTPNSKSRPGYLKLGWQDVGRIPIRVRVRRPMRFALNLGGLRSDNASASAPAAGAVKAGEVLMAGDSELPRLLKESEVLDDRFRTHRSNEYLRWRYAEAPLLDYRAVTLEGDAGMRGLAFFRIRPRGRLAECTVSELIVRNDDFHAARSLLKLVSRAASIDHLTCSFPSGSAADRAARASGFIRVPKGMDLVVKPLQEVAPDPTSLDSWALSLGDLEVF